MGAENKITGFVPKAFQHYPMGQLQKEYDDNLKRIQEVPAEELEELETTMEVPEVPATKDAPEALEAKPPTQDVTTQADDVADAKGVELAGKKTSSGTSATPFMLLGLVSAGALAAFLPSFAKGDSSQAYLTLEEGP